MPIPRVFIHIIRRDIRVGDNPITHHVSTHADLYDLYLPVFVFSSHQIELSGFIKDKSPNPFPPAKSAVAGYWRTGPHRVKFMAEAVWALKNHLESLGSGLVVRVGKIADTVRALALGLADAGQKVEVGAIWMTSHEGSEEKRDEREVEALCREIGAGFKLQVDEKYLIDDRDVKLDAVDDLPDVFTTYRKNQEPLHEKPREVLPAPAKGSLPRFPDISSIPAQPVPFTIPGSLEDFTDALVTPVKNFLPNIPPFPKSAVSAHPFKGGEEAGHARLADFIKSGGMNKYKDTRNGLLGSEFSTKLSAYLAQGCITARQIHHMLLGFENGTDPRFEDVEGYGKGENDGTQTVRFELLWRDYMRLCHRKFGDKFFRLEGFKFAYQQKVDGETPKSKQWKFPSKAKAPDDQVPAPDQIAEFLERFNAGTTGMGLIDASQRELMHTGYTSNRARQNVASFLAKHLDIDWRYGAEWYEMLLVDYDVSSNWANWQYVSGIGNDPRGDIRIFNPVKQAFEYDKEGKYVRSWVPELSKLERLEHVFQVCSAKAEDAESAGLAEDPMYTNPVKKITFVVGASPRVSKKGTYRRGGRRGAPAAGRAGRLGRSTANGADSADRSDLPGSQGSGGAPLNIDVRTTTYFAQAQRAKDTRPKDVSPPVIADGTLKSFNAGASRSFFRPTGSSQAQQGGVGSSRPSRGMSDRGRHGGSHQSTVHQSQAQQSDA